MPVKTRNSCKSRSAGARSRPPSTRRATTTNPSSARVKKSKPAPATSTVLKHLKAELALAVEQTRDLDDLLREIASKLKDAQNNLTVAKKHHHAAMEQARESKRIICRYLELGMTIPPCKSLDLPMEVYSDESNYKLAEMIKEQENHISRLQRNVDNIQQRLLESRKDVCRIKRKISAQNNRAKSKVP